VLILKRKLYLIGIDAAPLWLIERLSSEKHMDSFRNLIKGKYLVEMESTLPPMTGAAWPTIYTGLKPGEHGVPDFFVMKNDYTPDLVYFDSEKTPPFWKNLANSGCKCLIVTPATDIKLPGYANVDMITGFPLKAKTNSKFLESLMRKYKFSGEPDIETEMKEGRMSEEEGTRHFVESIRVRSNIAKEAMQKKDYDFVYVCFTETDRLQHFVLNKKDMDKYLLPIYQELGKYLYFIMEKSKKEGASVMIVSDHGSQPINEKFLMNAWLIKKGYATLKDSVMRGIQGPESKSQISYTIREKLLKTKLRGTYDKLPHAAKDVVSKSLGKLLSASSGGNYTRLHLFDYDMTKTKAFAAISNINVATIWINDSRFTQGIVSASEKTKLKKEITKQLLELKDGKGKRLIVNVWDGDKYYGRTKEFIQPDLLAEVREGYTIDVFNFSKTSIFMEPEPPKRGDHTRFGIYSMYPGRPKTKSGIFSILDVYSTILNYYKSGKK
jgi:predicted AlkP superfamily phosphohydrolase/phosphomutase